MNVNTETISNNILSESIYHPQSNNIFEFGKNKK